MNPTVNPMQANELILAIKWNPQNGSVSVSFPPVDIVAVLGLLEMAKVVLMEQRSKAENRIAIPDMQVTKRLVT